MAEPKVQLVAPIGNITVPGMNVTGVVTATTISGDVGVAGSIIQGTNLDIGAGIITATSFVGDQIGTYRAASLTGSPDLVIGVVTASSYVGDVTGAATSIIQGTNTNAGTFNATTFVGTVKGDITGDVIGNATGVGASVKQGVNLNVGVATASSWSGDGSGVTGVGVSAYVAQNVTASTAETVINLTYGNLIYLTQTADTTITFAINYTGPKEVTIIRDTDTSNTITWGTPGGAPIKWDGGNTPTLLDNSDSAAFQVFHFLSTDGTSYTAWEEMKNSPDLLQAFTWGNNQYGELGLNQSYASLNNTSSPTQIGTDTNWDTLMNQGGYPTWENGAIKTDGTLWTWGLNTSGQGGVNDIQSRSSPKQVGTDTTWTGYPKMKFTMAAYTKSDGTLWTCGSNTNGGLGHNNITQYSSPVQLPGSWSSGRRVTTVNKTGYGMIAIKTDGTLWSWGYAAYNGWLGQNQAAATRYSSPTQIGTDTTWSTVDVGDSRVMATKTDGTLWAWGSVSAGQLGLNDTTTSPSSPMQVGTDTTWSDALHTGATGLALKTDGTIWSWGYNSFGGLGQNNLTVYSSPIQIGTNTNWSEISGGENANDLKAIKTDGTLWSWGYNTWGQLGQNNRTNYSSPTQIGTATNWTKLGAKGAIRNAGA